MVLVLEIAPVAPADHPQTQRLFSGAPQHVRNIELAGQAAPLREAYRSAVDPDVEGGVHPLETDDHAPSKASTDWSLCVQASRCITVFFSFAAVAGGETRVAEIRGGGAGGEGGREGGA